MTFSCGCIYTPEVLITTSDLFPRVLSPPAFLLHPQWITPEQEVCVCSTNLGEPLFVHVVHHHDLVVEGDGRASGTETRQTRQVSPTAEASMMRSSVGLTKAGLNVTQR